MRKFFITITTILLVGVFCLSSLFGCKLITVNNERDMAQVVATIKIDDAPTKTIYKRDVIAAYNNYVNSGNGYGKESSEIYEEVIEMLIENSLLVQSAMKHFSDNNDKISAEDKWKIETYLDETEELDCEYKTYVSFEQFVDSFSKDKPEEKEGDTYTGTVRVVPTGATVNSEIDDDKKREYIKNFWKNEIVPEYNAYIKAINALKANDLLGNYNLREIYTIDYFNEIKTAYQEELLIQKYEKDILKQARNIVNYKKVTDEYVRLYEEQAGLDTAKFESKFASISADNPILSGQDGYGMVYHILLKADDAMLAELEKIKAGYGEKAYTNSVYRQDRAELFANITAQDQRTSWIESQYDFGGVLKSEQAITVQINGENKQYLNTFTGDYTLNSEYSLPFFGDVTQLNSQDANKDDYKAKYRVDETQEFTLEQILSIINQYLYEGSVSNLTVSDRAVYTASKVSEDYDKRVKELMFAFSQDDGDTALNTYKGYSIKPEIDSNEEREWMIEFDEVGKQLIKQKGKENTFMLVATDYGYHIMFFSEYFGDGYSFSTLVDYLDNEYGKKDWEAEFNYMVENYDDYEDTNNFMYILYNKLAATYVADAYSIETEKIFDQYANDSQFVVRYKDAYKDLVEE